MPNFNRKITLYTLTTASDGAGGTTASWDAGVVKWAEIIVTNNGKLFIQGQEYNETIYTIQLNGQSFNYTPPVENYKIEINAFGKTRKLKIISASQPDLLNFLVVLTCIEDNG